MYKAGCVESSGKPNYTVISRRTQFDVLLCDGGGFNVLYECSSLTTIDLGHN